MQLSPTHWDFEAPALSSLLSPGSALTCLTLPNCNLSRSALLEQEDRGGRRGPAEYFDTAQLNRDWTKTTTVAQSQTDATIRQVKKETEGGKKGG